MFFGFMVQPKIGQLFVYLCGYFLTSDSVVESVPVSHVVILVRSLELIGLLHYSGTVYYYIINWCRLVFNINKIMIIIIVYDAFGQFSVGFQGTKRKIAVQKSSRFALTAIY